MEIEEHKVEVDALAHGMFVSRLDRPWSQTPFLLQGFVIDSDAQITQLRNLCSHVYIDVHKSVGAGSYPRLQTLGEGGAMASGGNPLLDSRMVYPESVEVAHEAPRAQRAHDNARELAQRIIHDVREHQTLSPDAVAAAVDPIVESVVRSADAFFWIESLSRRDGYNYSHAINCCALAASFGRHIGLPKPLLVELSTAGMLLDIGKASLPAGTIDHDGPLDRIATIQMQRHVELGMELIERSSVGTAEILAMVASHHERHDGSGYPAGLSGTAIPLYGRMLGIIDTYDAMTSTRQHQPAMSRHDVLQFLYRERDRLFQGELVEQFTQCLGVYPTGSLVELSNGEVAVVMAQNPARRLFPRVTVLTDADKRVDPAFRQLDLLLESMASNPKQQIRIMRALPPGAHGLELDGLYL